MTASSLKLADTVGPSFTLPSQLTSRFVARSQNKRQALTSIKKQSFTYLHPKNSLSQGSLSYSITTTSTSGPILVARSPKGISAILLGGSSQDERELEQDLKRRFPKHLVRRIPSASAEDDSTVRIICQYIDGEKGSSMDRSMDIELDMIGTTFQKRIWHALREIPAGETESYQQLTARANLPSTSVRAVANACGSNHVAVLIPCHRVIRSDGGIGGYHWGLDLKTRLLDAEKKKKRNEW